MKIDYILAIIVCIVLAVSIHVVRTNGEAIPLPTPTPTAIPYYPYSPTPTPMITPLPTRTPEIWIITEYTAGFESTGKRPGDKDYGITASGKYVKVGYVACDPKYPFGTQFNIEGFGTLTCMDRGSAIKGHHLDIYTPLLRDADNFGLQHLKVEQVFAPSDALRSTK